jgi:short-subunit dehydrogenase
LAARGAKLILVARRKDRLKQVADAIVLKHKVEVTVIVADLSEVGAAEKLFKTLERKKLSVDVLINNAGFGTFGKFKNEDIDKISEEIRLNVLTLVELSRLALPSMLKKKRGVILNVASTAAYQSIPYMAVYAATKAYVTSFSEALRMELAPEGITVTALCPGPVPTEFFEVASRNGETIRAMDRTHPALATPAKLVVRAALRGIERNKPGVIPNRLLALLVRGSRLLPPHPALREFESLLLEEWQKSTSLVEEARQLARQRSSESS